MPNYADWYVASVSNANLQNLPNGLTLTVFDPRNYSDSNLTTERFQREYEISTRAIGEPLINFSPERLALHETIVGISTQIKVKDEADFVKVSEDIYRNTVLPNVEAKKPEFQARETVIKARSLALTNRYLENGYVDADSPLASRITKVTEKFDKNFSGFNDELNTLRTTSQTQRLNRVHRDRMTDLSEVVGFMKENKAAIIADHVAAAEILQTNNKELQTMISGIPGDTSRPGILSSGELGDRYEHLTQLPAGERKGFLIVGGAASGKGGITDLVKSNMPDSHDLVHINPDLYNRIMKPFEEVGENIQLHSSLTHTESSMVTKALSERWQTMARTGAAPNILMDVQRAGPWMRGVLGTAGTQVEIHSPVVPINVALERAYDRGQKVGRYVPTPDIILGHKEQPAINLGAFESGTDFTLYNTNVPSGTKVQDLPIIAKFDGASKHLDIYDASSMLDYFNKGALNTSAINETELSRASTESTAKTILDHGRNISLAFRDSTGNTYAQTVNENDRVGFQINDITAFDKALGKQQADNIIEGMVHNSAQVRGSEQVTGRVAQITTAINSSAASEEAKPAFIERTGNPKVEEYAGQLRQLVNQGRRYAKTAPVELVDVKSNEHVSAKPFEITLVNPDDPSKATHYKYDPSDAKAVGGKRPMIVIDPKIHSTPEARSNIIRQLQETGSYTGEGVWINAANKIEGDYKFVNTPDSNGFITASPDPEKVRIAVHLDKPSKIPVQWGEYQVEAAGSLVVREGDLSEVKKALAQYEKTGDKNTLLQPDGKAKFDVYGTDPYFVPDNYSPVAIEGAEYRSLLQRIQTEGKPFIKIATGNDAVRAYQLKAGQSYTLPLAGGGVKTAEAGDWVTTKTKEMAAIARTLETVGPLYTSLGPVHEVGILDNPTVEKSYRLHAQFQTPDGNYTGVNPVPIKPSADSKESNPSINNPKEQIMPDTSTTQTSAEPIIIKTADLQGKPSIQTINASVRALRPFQIDTTTEFVPAPEMVKDMKGLNTTSGIIGYERNEAGEITKLSFVNPKDSADKYAKQTFAVKDGVLILPGKDEAQVAEINAVVDKATGGKSTITLVEFDKALKDTHAYYTAKGETPDIYNSNTSQLDPSKHIKLRENSYQKVATPETMYFVDVPPGQTVGFEGSVSKDGHIGGAQYSSGSFAVITGEDKTGAYARKLDLDYAQQNLRDAKTGQPVNFVSVPKVSLAQLTARNYPAVDNNKAQMVKERADDLAELIQERQGEHENGIKEPLNESSVKPTPERVAEVYAKIRGNTKPGAMFEFLASDITLDEAKAVSKTADLYLNSKQSPTNDPDENKAIELIHAHEVKEVPRDAAIRNIQEREQQAAVKEQAAKEFLAKGMSPEEKKEFADAKFAEEAYTNETIRHTDGKNYSVLNTENVHFDNADAAQGKKTKPTFIRIAKAGEEIITNPGKVEESRISTKGGEVVFVNKLPNGVEDAFVPRDGAGNPNGQQILDEKYEHISGDMSTEGGLYRPKGTPSKLLHEVITQPTVIKDAWGPGQHQFLSKGATLKQDDNRVTGIDKAAFDETWSLTDSNGHIISSTKSPVEAHPEPKNAFGKVKQFSLNEPINGNQINVNGENITLSGSDVKEYKAVNATVPAELRPQVRVTLEENIYQPGEFNIKTLYPTSTDAKQHLDQAFRRAMDRGDSGGIIFVDPKNPSKVDEKFYLENGEDGYRYGTGAVLEGAQKEYDASPERAAALKQAQIALKTELGNNGIALQYEGKELRITVPNADADKLMSSLKSAGVEHTGYDGITDKTKFQVTVPVENAPYLTQTFLADHPYHTYGGQALGTIDKSQKAMADSFTKFPASNTGQPALALAKPSPSTMVEEKVGIKAGWTSSPKLDPVTHTFKPAMHLDFSSGTTNEAALAFLDQHGIPNYIAKEKVYANKTGGLTYQPTSIGDQENLAKAIVNMSPEIADVHTKDTAQSIWEKSPNYKAPQVAKVPVPETKTKFVNITAAELPLFQENVKGGAYGAGFIAYSGGKDLFQGYTNKDPVQFIKGGVEAGLAEEIVRNSVKGLKGNVGAARLAGHLGTGSLIAEGTYEAVMPWVDKDSGKKTTGEKAKESGVNVAKTGFMAGASIGTVELLGGTAALGGLGATAVGAAVPVAIGGAGYLLNKGAEKFQAAINDSATTFTNIGKSTNFTPNENGQFKVDLDHNHELAFVMANFPGDTVRDKINTARQVASETKTRQNIQDLSFSILPDNLSASGHFNRVVETAASQFTVMEAMAGQHPTGTRVENMAALRAASEIKQKLQSQSENAAQPKTAEDNPHNLDPKTQAEMKAASLKLRSGDAKLVSDNKTLADSKNAPIGPPLQASVRTKGPTQG